MKGRRRPAVCARRRRPGARAPAPPCSRRRPAGCRGWATGNLVLEEVAAEAGYTRGALYHQFRDKEALVLATLDWVHETWYAEVGAVFEHDRPPVEALVELARRHAVYCRRYIARMMVALRVEFSSRDHPLGDAVRRETAEVVERVGTLIAAGRRDGSIGPGPPTGVLAAACLAAIEAAAIALAGRVDDDEEIAQRVVLGLLVPAPAAAPARS